jgi:hypothetical protein
MTPLRTIKHELRKLGYASEALFRDYCFADVLGYGDSALNSPRPLSAKTLIPWASFLP